MKIVVMVLAGIGAVVLIGGVVVPLIGWLLGVLGWIVAGALVIGGGVLVAKRLGSGKDRAPVVTGPDGRRLD
jgi:hypothetical protein